MTNPVLSSFTLLGLSEAAVQQIICALERFSQISSAQIFGSRAMGNFKQGSDVDIAIFGSDISFDTLSALHSRLNEELPLPWFFDVIHFESLTEEALKTHIVQEGKIIYQRQEPSMTILHHGAINGVTGSCHQLLFSGGDSVLVDCGLFQGAEVSAAGTTHDQLAINFDVSQLKALVVTHVHIDHVGRIPYLFAAGFSGPIICSEASAHLLPLVLADALKIGFSRDRSLVKKALNHMRDRIVPLAYKRWYPLLCGDCELKVKLSPAGHILGSAYVEFMVKQGAHKQRLLFSGDLGSTYTPLLSAPKSPYRTDLLVLESTYGDKNHPSRHQRHRRLQMVIETALRDRGTVLIPAFSIGRTQELLYELEHIIHQNRHRLAADNLPWEDLEVIVDSPLAANFTSEYRQLKRFWDREAKRRVGQGRHPLAFSQLLTIDDHQTHLQTVAYLAKTKRPAIVIAASGMCTGGRVVNYLKAMLGEPQHNVLFVGYQAKGTPGRMIQKYGPQQGYVELDGKRYTIRAGVETISGYSAHADQQGLLNFVKRMRIKPRTIRLVHGDERAKRALQQALQQQFSGIDVEIP